VSWGGRFSGLYTGDWLGAEGGVGPEEEPQPGDVIQVAGGGRQLYTVGVRQKKKPKLATPMSVLIAVALTMFDEDYDL